MPKGIHCTRYWCLKVEAKFGVITLIELNWLDLDISDIVSLLAPPFKNKSEATNELTVISNA